MIFYSSGRAEAVKIIKKTEPNLQPSWVGLDYRDHHQQQLEPNGPNVPLVKCLLKMSLSCKMQPSAAQCRAVQR